MPLSNDYLQTLDEPRSPSSPPPPPPDYYKCISASSFPRSPNSSASAPAPVFASTRASLPDTTTLPLQQPTSQSNVPISKPPRRPARGASRTAQAAEDRARARAERERQRALKEAELQANRSKRIRAAFQGHQATSLGRQSSVSILVSSSLYNDNSSKDVLKSVRLAYPEQIHVVSRTMANLITWQRLENSGGNSSSSPQMKDVPICVFIFQAPQYLAHITGGTLDDCAKAVKEACLSMHTVVFALCGMERECKRLANAAMNNRSTNELIIDKRAVHDSYVHLYTEHGIRTHDAQDLEQLVNYLRDVTDAIAAAPFRKENDFVSASLRNRVSRAHASHRTVVVSSQQTATQSQDSDDVIEEDPFSYDPAKKTAPVRIENIRDLGNIYLSMLCLIPGVTLKKAHAIREKYPTLRLLLDAYDDCNSDNDRELLLAEVRSGDANRRLGPALSKVIGNVLTSIDPNTSV